MSIEGLWSAEIYGLHGWENTGAVVLQKGHALGGGRNHYSVGSYKTSGNEISLSIDLNYHGKPRVMFGSSDTRISLKLEGEHRGEVVEGTVHRVGNPKQTLLFRLTKRAELP